MVQYEGAVTINFYGEKLLSFPRPQIQYTRNAFFPHSQAKHLITSSFMLSITPLCVVTLLIFSDTLEHILLTDAQTKLT